MVFCPGYKADGVQAPGPRMSRPLGCLCRATQGGPREVTRNTPHGWVEFSVWTTCTPSAWDPEDPPSLQRDSASPPHLTWLGVPANLWAPWTGPPGEPRALAQPRAHSGHVGAAGHEVLWPQVGLRGGGVEGGGILPGERGSGAAAGWASPCGFRAELAGVPTSPSPP